MKKHGKTVRAIMLIVGFLVNTVFAEVRILNHGGASLPRESEDLPAYRGESWGAASANWMTLLRNGGTQLGVDRSLVVRKHDLGDYKDMLTSTQFRTWKGLDDSSGSTVEWGNFWHQGVQIIASNGSTFVPAEVSVNVQSFTGNTPGAINRTVFFTELNNFRQVLNTNNSVASAQNPNGSVNNFIYGGIGIALTMGGTGTVQERLNATANHFWQQDYKLKYTVNVPYTPASGPKQIATMSWWVERIEPVISIQGDQLSITGAVPGKTYQLQNSPTLTNWQTMQFFTGNVVIAMPHKGNPAFPKMFYRILY